MPTRREREKNICDLWRFHKRIVLAALTRFQALAFGVIIAESDRDALIRQLLCSGNVLRHFIVAESAGVQSPANSSARTGVSTRRC